ncbi:hypothetical protein [Labedella endophytica]|uniref:Cation-transporting ATPase n=1 Tax=Labedella endophytica TaxID=1523160 RepID=A0A433JVT7_9MICO|nr:hypothetical protein [Labedella endophytica]RUR03098.1 hypothetical protein ELQ94_00625 [Labedella endophytica]
MPDFKRLLGAAAKALGDSSSSSGSPQNRQGGSSTDWKNIVRTAADKLTGDAQPGQTARGASSSEQSWSGSGTGAPGSGTAPGYTDRRPGGGSSAQATEADRIALGKYDYLLRTAPPGQLEQVHHDAFERLTPAQREQLQARLTEELPAHEHPRTATPHDLALAATRGETAQPGLMKRVFDAGRSRGGRRRGAGIGGVAAGAAAGAGVAALGGVALAVAGGAVASSVAGPLLSDALASGVDFSGLADGFGFEGLSGVTDGIDGLAQSGEDFVGGIGEQFGDAAQGFEIPGLGDLFGR